MDTRIHAVAVLFLALGLVACGESADKTSTDSGRSEPAQSIAATQPAEPATVYDVCVMVPAEEAAATIGAVAVSPGRGSDYGVVQGCEYDFDPAGDDRHSYHAIWIGQPVNYSGPEDSLATSIGLGQTATMEILTGLGDEAFVIHNASERQAIIHVLLRDRVSVEIKAERFEDGLKLADLVLGKL